MSQNLDLLRQNFCRPARILSKGTNDLFPLEEKCEQGKSLLLKAPETTLYLQDFDPYGLYQSYRQEGTTFELPLFAVFDLEGDHRLSFEITNDSISPPLEAGSLPSYLPLAKTQASVREINKPRIKANNLAGRISLALGAIGALMFLLLSASFMPDVPILALLAPVGGWTTAGLLTYVVAQLILDRTLPWKKVILTADFDGILPRRVRERARVAQSHFDHLYLIVEQQHRWESTLLPDPIPRSFDPLLIAELKQGRQRHFYLIEQFDLTPAEQYLAEEFAAKIDET